MGCTSSTRQIDSDSLKSFTRKEVAAHNTATDNWIIIDDLIYDVTEYWRVHPGGPKYFLQWAGKDATMPYREYGHSPFAAAQLSSLGICVGKVQEDAIFTEEYFHPNANPNYSKITDIEDQQLLKNNPMFCFQCSQNSKNLGCSSVGVCGKNPTIACLQDLIVHYLKGLAQYLVKPEVEAAWDQELYHFYLEAWFMTLTNVNYDKQRHIDALAHCGKLRDKFKQLYEQKCANKDENLTSPFSPSAFVFKNDPEYLLNEGKKVGLEERKKGFDPDLFGLLEMCCYGMKGLAAYFYHAEQLRAEDKSVYSEDQRKEVFKQVFDIAAGMTKMDGDLNFYLGLNMNIGKANLAAMDYLDKGHTTLFGKPTPGNVPRAPVEGKCILVSGHDMVVLKKLLDQTQGTGINIYTHGEMLPAFGYPELRKYKHLVANFGTAWYDQNYDFTNFPGAIILNSNCLIQPRNNYKKRIFTTHAVGWPDVEIIKDFDFTKVIECAKSCAGMNPAAPCFKKYSTEPEVCGYGHATMTELLVPEIQAGHIKEIYLVGGCDNLDPERDFYRQITASLPKEAIILTLGCGKFRLLGMRDQLGTVVGNPNIPRLLDVGQCNDAYSAVKVAIALAGLLKVGVNDLPLHLVLSWVEQKAIVILLTLLHLGIKNIIVGPNLPSFLTPNLVKFLVENFSLAPTYSNKLFSSKQKLTLINETYQESQQASSKAINEFQNVRPWNFYQISKKTKLTEDVWSITCKFSNPNSTNMLDVGKHVVIRAMDTDGNWQSRCYTPITAKGIKGSFEILVKKYPNGLMSTYLDQLMEGSYIQIQGPCGQINYVKGVLNYEGREMKTTKINLISGGLAITTMYQFIQDIANSQGDNTKVSLIASFSNEKQILLKKEIETLTSKKPGQFKCIFPTSAKEGRISELMFAENLISYEKDVINIVGGPDSFRKKAIEYLHNLKYTDDQIVIYY